MKPADQDMAIQLEQIAHVASQGLDAATDTVPSSMRLLAAVQALRKVGQMVDELAERLGTVPVRMPEEWQEGQP